MRRALFLTVGVACLALSGAANAAVIVGPAGPADPQYFASLLAGLSDFMVGTTAWSGTGLTEKGSVPGQYAAPLGMGDTTYMAVEAGQSETATFATPQTSITIYWGSIDSPGDNINNTVTIDGFTFTGADLLAMGNPPVTGLGNQGSPADNQFVTIKGIAPFTTVTFADNSNANAFEFSLGSSVPEPSTWAMLALGFAGLGYAAFRRNSKKAAIGAI